MKSKTQSWNVLNQPKKIEGDEVKVRIIHGAWSTGSCSRWANQISVRMGERRCWEACCSFRRIQNESRAGKAPWNKTPMVWQRWDELARFVCILSKEIDTMCWGLWERTKTKWNCTDKGSWTTGAVPNWKWKKRKWWFSFNVLCWPCSRKRQ